MEYFLQLRLADQNEAKYSIDRQIVTIFCFCDDVLKAIHRYEDKQCQNECNLSSSPLTHFCLSASGESQEERHSFGWEDATDVDGTIEYLNIHVDIKSEHTGILGCSIGVQIALQGAAYHSQIHAVWADGPSSITAADYSPPDDFFSLLATISGPILDQFYVWHLDIEKPRPMIDIIGEISPRPITLVGGGMPHPLFGNEEPRVSLYAHHAGDNAEIWMIPEARHCDGPVQIPEEYAERMVAFFDKALGVER